MEPLRDRFTVPPSARERMSVGEFEASVHRHGEAQARLRNIVTVESEARREMQRLSVARYVGATS